MNRHASSDDDNSYENIIGDMFTSDEDDSSFSSSVGDDEYSSSSLFRTIAPLYSVWITTRRSFRGPTRPKDGRETWLAKFTINETRALRAGRSSPPTPSRLAPLS